MTTRLSVVVVLSALVLASHAAAMDILDFARLNVDDQATYVTALVEGAAKNLRAHGHPDQAEKAIALFKDNSKSGGVNQLALNMKELHAENDHNAINPNNRAHVYDVEDAMELTLKHDGILVPARDLEPINRNFSPAFPLRSRILGQ